jgi:5-formyltetrahydrofolate cyclo-ligase
MHLKTIKTELRKHFLKKLQDSNFDINMLSLAIEERLKELLQELHFKFIGLYSAFAREPKLEITRFSDYQISLPKIHGDDLTYYPFNTNDTLSRNKYGIVEPNKTAQINPEVIIIPGLAFDESGARLGRGKGFFDRFIAKNQDSICVIGVCFELQITSELPLELHDRKVDYIITEQRTIKIK